VNKHNDTATAEVRTLQRIVEALDAVFYGNVDTMKGEHLNRLSEARAEAAFLLERARRRAGRELARQS